MATAALATKDKPATPPPAVVPNLEIDPAKAVLQYSGQVFKNWFIRCPEGMIAEDLRTPSVFRRVQGTNGSKSLSRHDHCYFVAWDETWAVDAVVVDASQKEAVLSFSKVLDMKSRIVKLFSDGTHEVFWTGTGYAARQISDGRRVTEVRPNEALAVRDLALLYPIRQ